MLEYTKMPMREAKRAWPKNETAAVAVETSLRDIERAGVQEFPHLDISPKKTVRCLYSPADNKILLDKGVHIAADKREFVSLGGKKSPFPGFCAVGGAVKAR